MSRETDVISAFREARDTLVKWKVATFKHRQKVFVHCGRYVGPGEAWHPENRDCPPDHLLVMLGNGNVWFYPLETIRVVQ